ncbi:MAG: KUP/HAK/KT family potassium transporter [Prevotella sp.]|jgi:KUP system potassium uptake protein|nr:KUP/HAK/KT family potassium transporter [Prevotella sp.]MCH3995477.1 KUP/HAK/KT family potassium transporter [Prevotella sp.]
MAFQDNVGHKQCHRLSFWGLIVTLGIVYGDIGTSPLYVMRAIVGATQVIDPDYILGAVSCIIWTITLQTTVKYVILALQADNNGEGGILALYALIRKHRKRWLYLVAIIGSSTLIADGVITPSITVMSAVEGLKAYEPSTPVIPICLCIITILFFIQQFGTEKIGRLFGPLMLVWFSMIGIIGLAHINDYTHILYAFNPYYAIRLLFHDPQWFLILGAVFLCTTGAEALYSDLGHCGEKNIRISWVFVKITLLLSYLGQGAWIIAHRGSLSPELNPFYAIMPHGMLFFGILMATIAAIIASQALISGSFTIFSEAMNLSFWPRQRIKYPTDIKGQLYIPIVNLCLWLCVSLVVIFFGNSSRMEAAYGLAITITMLMTTLLLREFMLQRRVSKWVVFPVITFFVCMESLFLIANLFKFVHGGWVTLSLAGIISFIMYVWYNASRIRNTQVLPLDIRKYFQVLSDIKADDSIPKFATNVVYLSKLSKDYEVEQKIMYSIINKHPVRADHYWLLHVSYEDEPSTLAYSFTSLIPDTLFRVNVRLGFRVQPYVNQYFRQIIEDLVASHEFDLASCYPSLKKEGIPGNFVFVIIKRIYTSVSTLTMSKKMIMGTYNFLSKMKQSIPAAFGLDTSNVMVEKVPLIVKVGNVNRIQRELERIEPECIEPKRIKPERNKFKKNKKTRS